MNSKPVAASAGSRGPEPLSNRSRIVLLLLVAGGVGWWWSHRAAPPVNSPPPAGDGYTIIADRIAAAIGPWLPPEE